MSDTLFEAAIERQVASLNGVPTSITSEGPPWFNSMTGQVNSELLITEIITQQGYRTVGRLVKDKNGKTIRPQEIRRRISEKLSPFVDAARVVDKYYNQLRDYLQPDTSDTELKTFTAEELSRKTIEKTPFVVSSILPCGLTILAAPPKTGKSWLCLDLANAVATGERFWGLSTSQGSVLYMALEDNEYRLQSRLRAIGSTMPNNLHLVCRNALCLDNGLIDQLENWINKHDDAKLIILDTLQRIKGAAQRGLDAYAADYARLGPLQELAINKKVAILAVHHFRKQSAVADDDIFERVAGSTALFGASDCAWAIYGKRGEDEKNLHITGRDVMDEEFKITFKKDISKWIMLGDSESLEKQRVLDEYQINPIVLTIRDILKSGDYPKGITLKELGERVTETTGDPSAQACSRESLSKQLDRIHASLIENDNITFKRKHDGANRLYIFQYLRRDQDSAGTDHAQQGALLA